MDKFEQLKEDYRKLEQLTAGFAGSEKEFQHYTEECAVRIWGKNNTYEDTLPNGTLFIMFLIITNQCICNHKK